MSTKKRGEPGFRIRPLFCYVSRYGIKIKLKKLRLDFIGRKPLYAL